MAQPRPDLRNDVGAAKAVMDILLKSGFVSRVYLSGSRSPKSKKPPTAASDWDLIAIVDRKIIFPDFRKLGYHVCVAPIKEDMLVYKYDAVEIYPNDEFKILGGV